MRETISQRLTLPGSLEPYEKSSLYARVTGYLDEIRVDIGDIVTKGQVLARLSVPEMKAMLKSAEADLLMAKADEKLADITFDRLAELHRTDPDAITEQDVDIAEAKAEVARAGVLVAEAKLEELHTLSSYATIRAPFDGVVVRRVSDTGTLITAGSSNSPAVVEIIRFDKYRLVLNAPESIVAYVRPGLEVSFTLDAFPGRTFVGAVDRTAGALTPETRSMRVEIDLDNSTGELRAGMYATVEVELGDLTEVLTLPAAAVRIDDGVTIVYAVVDGVLRKIPISIIKDDGRIVVVKGDMNSDTPVVLAGSNLLQEGDRVQVREKGSQK